MARSIKLTKETLASAMQTVHRWISEGLEGGALELSLMRPSKSREQEKHYHALIGDISAQIKVMGKKYSHEVWKALLVDQFSQDKRALGEPLRHDSQTVPAMDMSGRLVTIRASTTLFSKREGQEFIEFLYSQGIELGVRWSATAEQIKAAEGLRNG